MTDTTHAPETKGGDIAEAFGEFMNAFDAFRDANDQRLTEIESRFGEDVVTAEKVDRISRSLDEQKRALDQLTLKRARPALGRDGATCAGGTEHKEAFEAYVRSGDDRGMRALDSKAMSYGSAQDGGYLVPEETETEIGKRLSALSPIRSIASVRQISGAVLKKPFSVTGPATGWVAETASRPQTNTSSLSELQFPAMELRPLNLREMGTADYDITQYQPVLYRAESVAEIEAVVGGFFDTCTDESIEELRREHAVA